MLCLWGAVNCSLVFGASFYLCKFGAGLLLSLEFDFLIFKKKSEKKSEPERQLDSKSCDNQFIARAALLKKQAIYYGN